MSEAKRDIGTIGLFSGLTAEQLAAVTDLGRSVEWQAGDPIYSQGDSGSSMFAVVEGAVEIFRVVSGVEKVLLTVRAGDVFGLLSVLDPGFRPESARALENTTAHMLEAEALARLSAENPAAGARIFAGICQILGGRIRLLTGQYAAAIAWNLEVTGLASLNLERLMSERVEVAIETVRGEPISGTVVRFESSVAGHELYVATRDGRVHVVPYHAIVRLTVDRDAVDVQAADPSS